MRASAVFDRLRRSYLTRPLVLFAGAGATRADPASGYGVGSWRDLLCLVAQLAATPDGDRPQVGGATGDPIEDAERILAWLGSRETGARFGVPADEMADLICRAVTGGELGRPRNLPTAGSETRRIKMLPGAFLEAAPTMNAIVSLCAQLVATRGAPGKEVRFRVEPNPRIRAVITPNFDPYLEAAASRKFKRAMLKPVAAIDSSAGTHREVPVHHVHGYVPFARSAQDVLRRRLIFTRSDYERERNEADAYSPALGPQIHFLRHYPTLFIGYSFSDEWLNKTLRDIQRDRRDRRMMHFAIVHEDEFAGRRDELEEEFGVVLLEVSEFGQVPTWLGRLAEAGYRADAGERVLLLDETSRSAGASRRPAGWARRHEFSCDEAWSILMDLRLGALPAHSMVNPFLRDLGSAAGPRSSRPRERGTERG